MYHPHIHQSNLDHSQSVGVQVESSQSPQVAERRGQNLTDCVPGQGQVQEAGHVGKVSPSDSWI